MPILKKKTSAVEALPPGLFQPLKAAAEASVCRDRLSLDKEFLAALEARGVGEGGEEPPPANRSRPDVDRIVTHGPFVNHRTVRHFRYVSGWLDRRTYPAPAALQFCTNRSASRPDRTRSMGGPSASAMWAL